ncbi:hypothetical protein ILYODFUR_035215 [Ilyodon furcidens]|uniref:Uncharacterized protein n=1 Tax=Ilyodon furcidens TaxID=33524 RepID=A0ABV0UCA7_9TELE
MGGQLYAVQDPTCHKKKPKNKKHPLPPSCIHIKSLAPNVKTNNNGHHTLTHTPHALLYTPISRRRYPLGATSIWTQEVVPFPPGAETGTQRQHRQDPGDPANSTPKPRGRPSPPATCTPAWHITAMRGCHPQSSRPAPPSKRGHIPINAG